MLGPEQLARRLGLALNNLFPSTYPSVAGEHFAIMDGRRASFVYSNPQNVEITPEQSQSWQWSSDLPHHVIATDLEIQVRSGREQARRFARASVENRLEDFIAFLDSSRPVLPDVVSFLVQEFQSTWSAGAFLQGDIALGAFLLALSAADQPDPEILRDEKWRGAALDKLGVNNADEVLAQVTQPYLDYAEGLQARSPLGLKLVSPLVLRHAGGRLFQEAHAVIEAIQFNLFGPAKLFGAPFYSPSGAYFTPVRIARLMAEWALKSFAGSNQSITIADYACGSAIFLTEALRALDRLGYHGTVRLVGRDSSSQAITMATVAVRNVVSDLSSFRVAEDIAVADALDSTWPEADVVLMNPPFRSWENMDKRERDWVRGWTGDVGRGRPDLSVGFVERALQSLTTTGVLATMVPAGLLASEGLGNWRKSMEDRAVPNLIAVLGEHGLFHHALVNVGIICLVKRSQDLDHAPTRQDVNVAWSSAEEGSASRAIRALRQTMTGLSAMPQTKVKANGWSVTRLSLASWQKRPSWLPGAGALGPVLERVQEVIPTKVEDLFRVRQGIRTGGNEAFLITKAQVSLYPDSERAYFRPAVDTDSFANGNINDPLYLFTPDPVWTTEDDLSTAVPRFYRNHLQQYKQKLRSRKSLNDERWWTITRDRASWANEGVPRLLSKRFGLLPAFARDLRAEYAPVQANAWIPRSRSGNVRSLEVRDILTLYWWLLNSRVTVALFREYCPNVAGGQLDLEHKYVKDVPLPDLAQRLDEDTALQALAADIKVRSGDNLPGVVERDNFAAHAFSIDLQDWNLNGLGG